MTDSPDEPKTSSNSPTAEVSNEVEGDQLEPSDKSVVPAEEVQMEVLATEGSLTKVQEASPEGKEVEAEEEKTSTTQSNFPVKDTSVKLQGGDGEEDQSLTFPQKLMEILNKEDEHGDIISWLPHGRGFMIFKKKQFETDIMPKYFQKHSKYTSFTRKLNRWGFVRVTRGAEMGAYYNPYFQRGEERLCMQMSCHRPNPDGISSGTDSGMNTNQTMYSHMAIQQQQQQQHQQQQGYLMVPGQNYLQMQQQHMEMLMRHREQMMHRDAMIRSQGGVGGDSGGDGYANMSSMPMGMKQGSVPGSVGMNNASAFPAPNHLHHHPQAAMMMPGMMTMAHAGTAAGRGVPPPQGPYSG